MNNAVDVQELTSSEIDAVAGGPLWGLSIIPAVKLSAATKAAAVGAGAAAGIAGATAALSNNDE